MRGTGFNAGRLLARAGDAVWGGRTCFLALHRCAAPEDWAGLPNRGFYIDADYLDRLLGYVVRAGWQVVTVDAALAGGPGRRISFSIDDGYRDTVERIVPLFRRHGLPVTLYITSGIPDGTMPMWQSGLETIIAEQDTLRLPGGPRPVGHAAAKRAAYAKISALWDAGDPEAAYPAFCTRHGYAVEELRARHAISWPMLEALRGDPLVEIGAHTMQHPHLARLTKPEAAREIGGSGERLRSRLSVPCRHFAFPYGQPADCGPREADLAAAAGFASAATTKKGLVVAGADPFWLPRHVINGEHRRLLLAEAHLTGATGVLKR